MAKKLLIVKVGTDERPAGEKDIKAMQEEIVKLQGKNGSLSGYDVFVTHHAVEFDFFDPSMFEKRK